VLDGKKVRLGFQSDSFDPLRIDPETYQSNSNRELFELLKVKDASGIQSAEFSCNLSLGTKLIDMLSGDPFIVHLFKSLNL
jgi:hypothetical protein